MSVKKKVTIVVGTRPELIRFASLIHEFVKNKDIKLSLIHTGQHYSEGMNEIFFRELNLPKPDANLGVGGLSPNEQMGKIISGMGEVIEKDKPDIICVWGDTNSSLGVAIAANKTMTKLCHIEAGCRSHDFRMAEEYNRILIDHLSDILFPLSENDLNNLSSEKVHGKSIFYGDPLYDVFLENQKKAEKMDVSQYIKTGEKFALLTLHRAENVDNEKILKNILRGIGKIDSHKIIFPIHPRTKKMIDSFALSKLLDKESIKIIPPLGYFGILKVLQLADMVITDSGGLQKEAFFARRACVTLRKSTEWEDTVKLKANVLLDPESKVISTLPEICRDSDRINKVFNRLVSKPYGDGSATGKIVKAIIKEMK